MSGKPQPSRASRLRLRKAHWKAWEDAALFAGWHAGLPIWECGGAALHHRTTHARIKRIQRLQQEGLIAVRYSSKAKPQRVWA